jgi:hypothetical protein
MLHALVTFLLGAAPVPALCPADSCMRSQLKPAELAVVCDVIAGSLQDETVKGLAAHPERVVAIDRQLGTCRTDHSASASRYAFSLLVRKLLADAAGGRAVASRALLVFPLDGSFGESMDDEVAQFLVSHADSLPDSWTHMKAILTRLGALESSSICKDSIHGVREKVDRACASARHPACPELQAYLKTIERSCEAK